ncbi:hypothetical protein P152DRAFT_471512 [Eremomyces bilateralis CBS 781.70]|uniref:Uncharacterized protein n=1 Tax=Eremomyces bilateralis CBS 781.70 TaxID=1392243 RepID=A0A6G1GAB0_9PEZI|nr:uncharacterized protein P152DRAFT_471512 [Eremomyces bilateralis CBS 781.70]KAF1814850.1 hypothetical protein P152DRAFT_471512 [Eremomyces bilateralis CBS 781.70]
MSESSSPASVQSASPSIETLVRGRLSMNHRACPYKPLSASHFDSLKQHTVIEKTGERGQWCERHGFLVLPDESAKERIAVPEERRGIELVSTPSVAVRSEHRFRVSKRRKPKRMKVRVWIDCDHCVQMLGRKEWVYEADDDLLAAVQLAVV